MLAFVRWNRKFSRIIQPKLSFIGAIANCWRWIDGKQIRFNVNRFHFELVENNFQWGKSVHWTYKVSAKFQIQRNSNNFAIEVYLLISIENVKHDLLRLYFSRNGKCKEHFNVSHKWDIFLSNWRLHLRLSASVYFNLAESRRRLEILNRTKKIERNFSIKNVLLFTYSDSAEKMLYGSMD